MEYKARVVLAPDVHKVINYLTNNMKTEIGAVGKVKIRQEEGEKYFYVYKLLFPEQQVSGATIHFTPAMWGSLVKKYGLKELNDIAWYWHRHPGCASHSSTDEDETFEAFMDKDANRKFFIFYQTAVNSKNEWDEEARIDIRNPIRATILNKDISMENEQDADDDRIENICEQIVADAIVKEEVVTYKKGDFKSRGRYWGDHKCLGDTYDIETKVEEPDYTDNDILYGYATEDNDKVSIKFENGQATIKTGPAFMKMLIGALKKGGKLSPLVGKWTTDNGKTMKHLNLQPAKKSYQPLKETLLDIYSVFNSALLEKIKKENKALPPEDEDEEDTIVNITNDPELSGALIKHLEDVCKIEWKENFLAGAVYDSKMETMIGEIDRDKENTDVSFTGGNLVTIIKTNREFQKENEARKVLNEQIKEQNAPYLNGFYGYS